MQMLVETHCALSLDVGRLMLSGPLSEILLTQSEVSLLVGFVQAPDQVLEHGPVAAHLKLDDDPASRASLNVRLSQLRKKLLLAGAEEPSIRSIRGHGYKLCLKLQFG